MVDREALVDRLLADPPQVHVMAPGDPGSDFGVWSSSDSCYRFLAGAVDEGAATLETGCGLSTALFAGLRTHHVCVAPSAEEVQRLRDHCRDRGIELDRVRFVEAFSDEALPALVAEGRTGPLDLVLVDGGHGYPIPIIDWYYAGRLLRQDGLLVVDDIGLPAVRDLLRYLDADPGWRLEHEDPKWRTYRKVTAATRTGDWYEQPWYHPKDPGLGGELRWLRSRLAWELRRRRRP